MRRSKFCTECGKEHDYPEPEFRPHQRVTVVNADGYHHRDKVGCECAIIEVATFLVMPCDEVEYRTSFGHGFIKESRLKHA